MLISSELPVISLLGGKVLLPILPENGIQKNGYPSKIPRSHCFLEKIEVSLQETNHEE